MSAPAGHGALIAAQLAMDLRLALRRGENLLAMAVIPAAVLLFFASVPVLAVDGSAGADPVGFLLPGTIALAIIATSLVSLGISTAYERHYGVLKRLGGSPLGRAHLVVARVLAVLVLELGQVALLLAIALGPLGWSPPSGVAPLPLVAGLLLGTAAFAGIGLLLAGTLRAEATLAVANGLFLGCLLLGGIVQPVERLPDPLATIAGILPAAALAETMRAAFAGAATDPAGPMLLLAAWAGAGLIATVRTFRWE
jgi:ABC-2 type transport system permease protein